MTRAGEIIASREFYDYDDKYVLGLAETVAPTDLNGQPAARGRSSWSRSAYRALRVEGLARVDVFLRQDDEIVINEVNTMPGFTPDLHVPHAVGGRGRSLPVGGARTWCGWRGPPRPARLATHPPSELSV